MRLLIISDLHTGSAVGLRAEPANDIQDQLLDRFREVAEWCPEPDILIVNGDANDGQDPRGRNVEIDDVPWQIEEAERLILMLGPKRVRMTHGSAYHVGDTVAFEEFLSGYLSRRGIDCSLKPVQRITAHGWWHGLFRHKTSRSIVPNGRHTGPARSRVWSAIKAARKRSDARVSLPHLWCYSHVHYYGESADLLGRTITTPGWKAEGAADKFGARNFDDAVDIGAIRVTIGETEEDGWTVDHLAWPADLVDDEESL